MRRKRGVKMGIFDRKPNVEKLVNEVEIFDGAS